MKTNIYVLEVWNCAEEKHFSYILVLLKQLHNALTHIVIGSPQICNFALKNESFLEIEGVIMDSTNIC